MYSQLVAPLLQLIGRDDAERSHILSRRTLRRIQREPAILRLIERHYVVDDSGVEVAGLSLRNRFGIPAGLDKDCEFPLVLQALGVGFIELGTVTPQPQEGNPRPRMQYLPKHKAFWNWLGFNSDGAYTVRNRLMDVLPRLHIPVGVSIGKQMTTTEPSEIVREYRDLVRSFAKVADFISINISSPNTKDLRKIQEMLELLEELLAEAVIARDRYRSEHKPLPLLVKLAPDLEDAQVPAIVHVIVRAGIDGIIASNTTITPPAGYSPPASMQGKGGYSGDLLLLRTRARTQLIRSLTEKPLIAVGGIGRGTDARVLVEKDKADAVQSLTGLLYRGPSLIRESRQALAHH